MKHDPHPLSQTLPQQAPSSRPLSIYLIAAEESGDALGAALARALRKREDELRQVVDLTPQVVAVYGPRCERVYANRWALTYFGMTHDDWLKLPDGYRRSIRAVEATRAARSFEPACGGGRRGTWLRCE